MAILYKTIYLAYSWVKCIFEDFHQRNNENNAFNSEKNIRLPYGLCLQFQIEIENAKSTHYSNCSTQPEHNNKKDCVKAPCHEYFHNKKSIKWVR